MVMMGNSSTFHIRSWLIFPATEERFFRKVTTLQGIGKPDALIVDLEDSVADHPAIKRKARQHILKYLHENREYRQEIFEKYIVSLRINKRESLHNKEDKEVIRKIKPHIIFIPKVESADEIRGYHNEFPDMQLCSIIETIVGYENRDEIIRSLSKHDVLAIGYEDLSADLGIEKPNHFSIANPLIHILNACIITAKKYKVILVDGPSRKYGSEKNLLDLQDEALLSLQIGFQSKVTIHPSQIQVVNTIFSKEDIRKRATAIVERFHALNNGSFVIGTEEKEMIDRPSYRLYSHMLKLLDK